MSADIETVLVKDDRLKVHDTLKYAVKKGGQNITSSSQNANTYTADTLSFNIIMPSEQTILDRHVLIKAELLFEVTVAGLPSPFVVTDILAKTQYAKNAALCPFPLHSLMNTAQITINNNTVSSSVAELLPYILHMVRRKSMHRYSGTTPTALDTYANYQDDENSNNNALGGFQNAVDNDWAPRGSFNLKWLNNVGPNDKESVLYPSTGGAKVGTNVLYGCIEVTEPLMVSPFIFGHPYSNTQGMYGINSMVFQFNLNQGSRLWRTSSADTTCKFTGFNEKPVVQMIFITPHPSQLNPSRNIVAWYNLPKYITSAKLVADGSKQQVETDNIPLNQIPDKFIIGVRPKVQTGQNPDRWLSIEGISIDFNNQSGLLSSATKEQLYQMSIDSGINMGWNEWSGKATVFSQNAMGQQVATSGSILCLSFADQVQLTEDFYSSGSLGQFNFKVRLQVKDTNASVVPNITDFEIVLITMESGLFVCERGTSSVYSGVLSKQVVLDTSNQESYSRSDVDRMVGGGFLDGLQSVKGYIKKALPKVASTAVDVAKVCGPGLMEKMKGSGRKKSTLEDRFY